MYRKEIENLRHAALTSKIAIAALAENLRTIRDSHPYTRKWLGAKEREGGLKNNHLRAAAQLHQARQALLKAVEGSI